MALLAFAGNSIVCRLALAQATIDPLTFTLIRLISGALSLAVIVMVLSPKRSMGIGGSWAGAGALFFYAAFFSVAYVSLDTATGALFLFGTVQLSIILIGLYKGRWPNLLEWLGVLISGSGLAYLFWPELSSPSLLGAAFMMGAGVAWGAYTLIGRRSSNPLAETRGNFIRSLVFLPILLLLPNTDVAVSTTGVGLAILSGVVTSGVGYAIWYAAVPALSFIQAGVIQLLVPVIAALGGVVLLGEIIDQRLVVAAGMILGGIFITLMTKNKT